ncbi:putative clathrin assembly protein At5g57200 [Phragmites australis]|uniref:putative clathrin assembly protein At5g57200 n=1 Tax=Phragmites australis TaxID=29695 RepID=UPI002D77F4BE|nr:putative clathrin assembly protein At5g57200 [Phragmites australis]
MGTASVHKSWRKACGAIKDSATVGLAKVNSGGRERKDLDVAVVKATTHVERPPKERHLAAIFAATSSSRPLADVSYCVHALARRLSKTHNWVVALKTLIVIHLTLRDGDAAFREELLSYRRNGHALQMSNFKDDSSPLAWDCSAWVRTYALYLEERLECFRVLRYDIESERLRPAEGNPKGQSRTRSLGKDDLLDQLPALQQLLFRLVGCQPEGAAFGNYLIQYALALVLKESFKIYCAVNDGIINVVDVFFDMTKLDAIKALDIYRRTGNLAKCLSDFYKLCRGLELARNFQFPVLREPPSAFLGTMEEYIREAPRTAPVPNKAIEYRQLDFVPYQEEEQSPQPMLEAFEEPVAEEVLPEPEEEPQFASEDDDEPEIPITADLLGLHEVIPAAAELEESNALALAIVPPGGSNTSAIGFSEITGSSGWELALVTAQPSSSSNQLTQNKLIGGFDKLLLDSLYEDAARRKQATTDAYGNGHISHQNDPFAMSNGVAPPTSVQMSMMAQQQALLGMPQQFQAQYCAASQFNPFGDEYSALSSQGAPLHGSSSLI